MANPSEPQPDAPGGDAVPVATIEHDNSQLEEFVEQNKSKLLLGLGAILVIVIAYVGINFVKESGASKAAAALTGAETIEDLRSVVSDFPNNVVAGTAELLIVEKLDADETKADEAYQALKSFVDARQDHPLYYKGVSDLGLKEHQKGNFDAAAERFREASATGAAPGFIAQTALLRLGDVLTAKGLKAMAEDDVETAKSQFSEAQTVYEYLEEVAGENSSMSRLAKQRKERVPHLSIRPLTPEEGKAAADAAAAAANEADAGASVDEAPPVIDLAAPPLEPARPRNRRQRASTL